MSCSECTGKDCNSQRRSFFALFLLALLAPFNVAFARKREVKVTTLKELSLGLTPFKLERVLLKRTKTGVQALSLVCTHNPCNLKLQSDHLRCPCHGAKFSLLGKVLRGPARRPLPHYNLRVDEEGWVIVDFGSTVDASWEWTVKRVDKRPTDDIQIDSARN